MLSPVLFWDVDREHMDAEKHSAGIIQRVLEYGTLQDMPKMFIDTSWNAMESTIIETVKAYQQ